MKRCTLRTARPARLIAALLTALVLIQNNTFVAASQASSSCFAIRVVDKETGRGVPLVELRTTNDVRYYTDSHGIVAFYEPGLMDRNVFFHVESHGYEFPKDGFGYRGKRLKTTPGTTATLEVTRLNIAERLYRVTGQGIYRDSVLTERSVPLREPVLNGQVSGQDSVYTCIYGGRLFWLWGDTNRPSYPLGHFATAGAWSDLPGQGGLDPSVGVDLEYLVDEKGFSRPTAKLKRHGLVWLDGLMTARDNEGRERMVAKYALMKDLGVALERGLMVFNDEKESFDVVVRSRPDFLPYSDSGHAFDVDVEGQRYHYFATQFPLTVRMRVRSAWDDILDPNRYEALTSVGNEDAVRWVSFAELLKGEEATRHSMIETLKEEKGKTYLYDIASGRRVEPHGGSVNFNAHRGRWIMIVVEASGDRSYLGEVWYAEADTPVGPWVYARRVVTHDKYSFYNPMHHPYFDQDEGRLIYFEGTYAHTFSRPKEQATPRYDYNQMMYRLNLDDPRLALPAPIYQVNGKDGQTSYLLRERIEETGAWDSVASVPFYAMASDRARTMLVAVYAEEASVGDGQSTRLTTERPASSAKPLFYALPASEAENNPRIVPLFEYQQTESGKRLYSTHRRLNREGWRRETKPLCRVWKTPPEPTLLDAAAKPILGF